MTDEAEYGAKRAVVKEIRDYIATMGPDRTFSGTWLMAQLERIVPYRNPQVAAVVEGQVEAFMPDDVVAAQLAELDAETAE